MPFALLLALISVLASAEADSPAALRARLTQWHLLPVPIYSPETSLGAILTFAYLFRRPEYPDARVSNNMSLVGVTVRKQLMVKNKGDVFLGGEDWVISHRLEGRLWPDRFYGIGNFPDPDAPENFDTRSVWLHLETGYRAWRKLYLGPELELRYAELANVEPEGALATGEVAGSRPYSLLGLGGFARWDERDSNLNPGRGVFSELNGLYFPKVGGGGFAFARLMLDARYYRTLLPGHILATRVSASASVGEVPFHMLAVVGGDHQLRGIMEMWARDRQAMFATAEYRWNFFWRLGVVGFLGVGQARAKWGDFDFAGTHVAGGLGFRFMAVKDEQINLRVDVAYSDFGKVQAYFAVGEAF